MKTVGLWLLLVIHDADTGKLLLYMQQSLYPWTIEGFGCQEIAYPIAYQIIAEYRKKYPNAVVNMDCQRAR